MLHSQLQLGVEALDLCLAHCKIPNTVVKGTVSRNFLPSFFLLRERNLFEPLIHMLNYFGMYRIRKYFHQVCWVPNKFVALSLLPRWAYSSPGKNRLLDFSSESRFIKFLSRIQWFATITSSGASWDFANRPKFVAPVGEWRNFTIFSFRNQEIQFWTSKKMKKFLRCFLLFLAFSLHFHIFSFMS